MSATVSVIVPTLGGAPDLHRILDALAESRDLEIVLVHQGPPPPAETVAAVDRCLIHPRPLGFASAVNRGLARATGELVLLLNDDAEIRPEALARLVTHVRARPDVAATQPAILDGRDRIDSLGIAWNRWWQAVQVGRDRVAAGRGLGPPREVFGVHAAVGLFRRRALDEVAVDGEIFSETLDTYYEDVELAGRLRAKGWRAVVRPDVVAHHRGGGSAGSLGGRRVSLLYGNRILVLARLLGARILPRLPRILARDVLDGLAHPRLVPGILRGWLRAARLAPGFARSGVGRVDPAILRRFGGA